ncbi:MAG TPA: phosphatase PAP2-related protein [Anaeromyxobacteraceae bacterium]|nr:phosphatase PAP2-related protein [Anaeromyxobacteraceae bacterium]
MSPAAFPPHRAGRAGEGRAGAPGRGLAALRALWPAILFALAFRGFSYAAMTALALHSELRPAPTLPDAVLAITPYVAGVGRANYLLWLGCYLPLTLAFLWSAPRRWVRYMVTGGLVSLARGLCIAATGLGAPDPVHAGPGIGGRSFLDAWLDLCSPLGVFARGTASAYLTKDLFFSGHTATTFLILLYVWDRPRLRSAALLGHVLVVASVFLSHLHYTVDVLGAYAFTFAIFALREWRPARA